MDEELADAPEPAAVTWVRFATDSTFRRATERWVENLVNASIDAAKIVHAARRLPVPQTYREMLSNVNAVADLPVP